MRWKKVSLFLVTTCAALAWSVAAPSPAKPGPSQSVEITVEFFEVPASIRNPFIPDGSFQPGLSAPPSQPPGLMYLAGVLTPEQLKFALKDYRNNKDIDTVSSPPLFARSESKAVFKQVQEVRYATDYDQGKKPGDAPIPTKFENKEVGIHVEAIPTIGPDGNTIDLALSLNTCRLTGYMTLGGQTTTFKRKGKITDWYSAIPEEYPNTENIQPIFASQNLSTQVTCYDNSSVVLGGLVSKDEAGIERKSFILVTAKVVPTEARE